MHLKTLATTTAVAVMSLTMAVPGTAQAAVSVSCQASGTTSFSPGIQAPPLAQQIEYRGNDRNCADHSGSGIRSARLTAGFSGVELSCVASGGGTGTGSVTIEWTTDGGPQRSEVDVSIDGSTLNSGRVSGTVTSGLFQGQRFSGQFDTSLVSGAFGCTFGAPLGGIRSAGFNGSYTIG